MEKKKNTPRALWAFSFSFFLERKENRELLRGSEKESINIACSEDLRSERAGLFLAADVMAYSSQRWRSQANLPECTTMSGGLWEE
jgi:hypothetical protein